MFITQLYVCIYKILYMSVSFCNYDDECKHVNAMARNKLLTYLLSSLKLEILNLDLVLLLALY